MYKKNILVILLTILNSSIAAANATPATPVTQNNDVNINTVYNQVIDSYKAYLLTIKPQLRDEIIAYRKEVASINKRKRELYRQLSQEGQNFLAKEQEFRKKLPMRERSKINIQTPGERIRYDQSEQQDIKQPEGNK